MSDAFFVVHGCVACLRCCMMAVRKNISADENSAEELMLPYIPATMDRTAPAPAPSLDFSFGTPLWLAPGA